MRLSKSTTLFIYYYIYDIRILYIWRFGLFFVLKLKTSCLHMFNINNFSKSWVQNRPEIHQPQEPGMWRGWPPDLPMENSGFQCTLCRWVPSTPGMREFWNTGLTNAVMGNYLLPQTAVRLPLPLTFNMMLTLTLNVWNTSDTCVRYIYFTDMCAHNLWPISQPEEIRVSELQDENNDMKEDRNAI